MKKNILVTGGCGFIGSHFVEKLLRFGNTEVVFTESREIKKPVAPAKVEPTEEGFTARLKIFPLLSLPYFICISPDISCYGIKA